jgi:hypothetical protein
MWSGSLKASVTRREVTPMAETALGRYAFGLVLVLLLFLAFLSALREKYPDGYPATPTGTVVPQPSPATSPGVSQSTTTAP